MTYRKFKADHLFNGREMAEPGSVLVTTADGLVQAILPEAEAGEDIVRFRGILSPGFINCHCHLELSHLRGLLPERTGLVDFLLAVMRQRNVSGQEDLHECMAAAEEAMLQSGIVAVGDICNTVDSIDRKKAGRLHYHNFIETAGFADASAAERFAASRRVFEAFAEIYPLPIETNSIVPHAPYSVSSRLFGLIADFPGNHLLSIHNQEAEAENDFYQNGQGDLIRLYAGLGQDISSFIPTGKRSLASYLGHFYRNQTLLLVHNLATGEEDLDFVGEYQGAGLYFCLCPNANRYIDGRLPDVDALVRHGCRIVLGTDSLASNRQLSILEELKTLQEHFPHLATSSLLQWATANGAEALQLGATLGSFAPGRRPGVLLIENTEGSQLTAASRVQRLL
jgi:cytosine/adenosine deaminase-related metal-dependent hydrolase